MSGFYNMLLFLVIFILFTIISFFSNRNAFLLVFYTLINPLQSIELGSIFKLTTFLLMILPLIHKYIPYFLKNATKELRTYVYWSFAFSIFWVTHDFLKAEAFHPANIIFGGLFFYGSTFLIFPVFYLVDKDFKGFINTCFIVAVFFVLSYYLDLIFNLNWYGLRTLSRFDQGEGPNRTIGFDVRQSFMIFAYSLPILLTSLFISKKKRSVPLIVVALISLIPVIGLMRLVILYLTLSFLFLYNKLNLLRARSFKSLLFIFPALILILGLYSDTLHVYSLLITSSFESLFESGRDSSADVRLLIEVPFLWELFVSHMYFGVGYQAVISEQAKLGVYALQDVPILGSLATYGIIGLGLYLGRFISLIKIKIPRMYQYTDLKDVRFIVYYTLKVYFISMISYRFFYVTWELTFPYQQLELALFAGLFFSTTKQINAYYQ